MWSSTGYGDVCVDFHYLYMPAEVTVSIMEKDKEVSSVSKVMGKLFWFIIYICVCQELNLFILVYFVCLLA